MEGLRICQKRPFVGSQRVNAEAFSWEQNIGSTLTGFCLSSAPCSASGFRDWALGRIINWLFFDIIRDLILFVVDGFSKLSPVSLRSLFSWSSCDWVLYFTNTSLVAWVFTADFSLWPVIVRRVPSHFVSFPSLLVFAHRSKEVFSRKLAAGHAQVARRRVTAEAELLQVIEKWRLDAVGICWGSLSLRAGVEEGILVGLHFTWTLSYRLLYVRVHVDGNLFSQKLLFQLNLSLFFSCGPRGRV